MTHCLTGVMAATLRFATSAAHPVNILCPPCAVHVPPKLLRSSAAFISASGQPLRSLQVIRLQSLPVATSLRSLLPPVHPSTPRLPPAFPVCPELPREMRHRIPGLRLAMLAACQQRRGRRRQPTRGASNSLLIYLETCTACSSAGTRCTESDDTVQITAEPEAGRGRNEVIPVLSEIHAPRQACPRHLQVLGCA